jgi:hypothetical protein
MYKNYSALNLLFYVSKLLGFAPYTLLENNSFVPSRIAKKYSILLCIVVLAAETEVFAFQMMKNTPVLIFGLVLLSLSSVVTHVLSVFISISASRKFIRISEKIGILHSMFHQTFDVRKRQFYALVAQLAFGFTCVGSYLLWDSVHVSNKEGKWESVVTKLVCILGDYVVVLQYINLVLIAGQYFSHMNIQLIQLEDLFSQKPLTDYADEGTVSLSLNSGVTSSKPAGHQLRDRVSSFPDLHKKLFETTRSINSAYSLQILFIVAKIFVHITFCLYLFFVVIYSEHYDKHYGVHALFFCFWTIFQLVLIVVSCDFTKSKVNMTFFK